MTTVATSRYAEAHAKQHGPGDERPTALQIVRDEQREGNMTDKAVFITGCSSGLGVETARAMKATGATVFVTARNLEKAKEALGDILSGDRVHLLKMDLESFDSVRSCVNEFKSMSSSLNILIENAGIRHVPFGRTRDGFEKHWGTNHLSHFLLLELLRPMLLASSTPEFCSRAIIVSSTAHRNAPMDFSDLNWEKRKYVPSVAYGQSKLANVYTASEIERRYGAQGLHAWSVHPGGIRTGLQAPSTFDIKDWLVVIKSGPMATLNTMMNAEQGASTSVWAALSRDLEGQGGKYCERNRFSEPLKKGWKMIDPGHAEWCYDEKAAARLYDLSMKEINM
ncbi:WW domain-containing oxidoreductase [Trichoderma lentiforme]|uniref:WW domain-containing oxidoreductase n=1 Tax=Trichoderma lentiforme TaxID=1567552 RepID=A0A9P5CE86_9HYPO|nr:WW domain-containing oxidoreductase [Trichoderma lentiforme]